MLNVSGLPTRKWKKLRLLRVTPTLKEAETVFNTSDMTTDRGHVNKFTYPMAEGSWLFC